MHNDCILSGSLIKRAFSKSPYQIHAYTLKICIQREIVELWNYEQISVRVFISWWIMLEWAYKQVIVRRRRGEEWLGLTDNGSTICMDNPLVTGREMITRLWPVVGLGGLHTIDCFIESYCDLNSEKKCIWYIKHLVNVISYCHPNLHRN